MRKTDTIIIKRKRPSVGGPKGGGAWKVAFADFTLAMMSLFLVLWILAISTQTERTVLATHLRDYSLMDNEANPFDIKNSPFPIDLEGNPSVLEQIAPSYTEEGVRNPPNDAFHRDQARRYPAGKDPERLHGRLNSPAQMQRMADAIARLGQQLETRNNLALQLVPQGLRIQIRDDDARQMFSRGSTQLSPFFYQLLRALAPVLGSVDNRLMVSGHTDSVPYPDGNYSNWELSGDRAQMARRVLVAGGLPAGQVAQVLAMGDTALAQPDAPTASVNRRIELLLLNQAAEAQLAALFASEPGNAAPPPQDGVMTERQQIQQQAQRLGARLQAPSGADATQAAP